MRKILLLLAQCLLALGFVSCANFNVYSEEEEAALGAQFYPEATKGYREITGTPEAQMVQRIGRRIADASGKGSDPNYQWEFKLFDSKETVNAFCLPGGKVAVFTGLLDVTQNEDALAVVVGHEVAHATERHGGERMSREGMLQVGLAIAAVGLAASDLDDDQKILAIGLLGAGATLGVTLPWGRSEETEADEVGLRYAIRAGYDPWEAPKLWERMAAQGGGGMPEWLSTHPDPSNRAENLRNLIPRMLAEEGKPAAPSEPAKRIAPRAALQRSMDQRAALAGHSCTGCWRDLLRGPVAAR
ncbi:MAG: hypothetical protein RL148_23 [Planctomycetota bacterium]|jgi:predicted Zn-dependent protease